MPVRVCLLIPALPAAMLAAGFALGGCNNAGDRPNASDAAAGFSSQPNSPTDRGARATDSRAASAGSAERGTNRSTAGSRRIPSHGSDTTLDIASWNIEWFGDPTKDPSDDALQGDNVRDVIAGTDADIWGLEEVVDVGAWQRLKRALPAYDGFLANESPVVGGRRFYAESEQKVGVLFKRDMVRVLEAKIILTQNNNDFAGRPPLQVRMRVTLNGRTEELVLIVLHMKATTDDASWRKRANAADALKQYLDATWPLQRVLVVGDWNDDVDQSLTRGRPSPYDNFVQDVAHYRFITAALSARGVSSTASFHEMIDHHLATNALAKTEIANAVEVETMDRLIPNYKRTTSDHYPVISHYVVPRTP